MHHQLKTALRNHTVYRTTTLQSKLRSYHDKIQTEQLEKQRVTKNLSEDGKPKVSTGPGYGWEGLRQVCAMLLGARHVPERLCGGFVYLGAL